MGWLVTASQSRAVLSSLPVSTVLPSGLKATARTFSRCRMGSPTGFPVAAFHHCTVPSPHPVSTDLPSGLNATA